MEKAPLIALAAGGTGGHIFPAQALGEVLKKQGFRVLYVTEARGQRFQDNDAASDTALLTIGSASGGGLLSKLRKLTDVLKGAFQAYRIMKRENPAVIVGFGGHPSAPAMVAGVLLRLPRMVHEQNAVLGRSNRILANHVSKIATSHETTRNINPRWQDKVVYSGNPVRLAFQDFEEIQYAPPGSTGPINILIIGGSQGAKALSDLVPVALGKLPEDIKKRLNITQQCRPELEAETIAAYKQLEIKATVSPFFNNIPTLMSQAHLVICRSGASTVSEIIATNRPAIFIPYPYAKDNHQMWNVKSLSDNNAAILLTEDGLNSDALADKIAVLLSDHTALKKMAKNLLSFRREAAAEKLAEVVRDLSKGQS